nr:immunoglobulin light chain junction region [Macaca mulatta]MOV72229.1 immunoglobulin light chain junction region [Macaca mulatta]MOV72665.1 immunoglobulin light chain junction region [Macaca mulatta]MOW28682.1 immunoglobulin light chain junction region [Macaca mulatta]MOW30278.1 immunoglobulin light chain junction region [Macaca mulatta]
DYYCSSYAGTNRVF